MTEKIVDGKTIQPGQYYQGRKITAVDPMGSDKVWVEWEGEAYPRGGFFSTLAEILVEIFGGGDVVDGEIKE